MNLHHYLAHQERTDDRAIAIPASRKDLCDLFAAFGFTSGAEIGVWEGEFSEEICRRNPGVRLLCVDPWKAYDDYGDPKNVQARLGRAKFTAEKRLGRFGCVIRQMSSTEAASSVPDGSLDFVYLDGNHAKAYVLADLAAWAPKVRSGGIVSGHDYEIRKRHAHLQVKEAVDEYAKRHKIAPIYILARDKSPSFLWRAA